MTLCLVITVMAERMSWESFHTAGKTRINFTVVVLINGTITEPAATVQYPTNNTDRGLMHVQHEAWR